MILNGESETYRIAKEKIKRFFKKDLTKQK